MASSEEHIASDFQAFRSHDGEPLDSHFKGAIHLEDQHQRNIMFMVDNNGEMLSPMRIEHESTKPYSVMYSSLQGQTSTSQQIQSPHEPPMIDAVLDDYQIHPSCAPKTDEILLHLAHLYYTFEGFYKDLKSQTKHDGDSFQRTLFSARLYHAKLIEEIERLTEGGIEAQVGEMSRGQILKKLWLFKKQVADWEYDNTCWDLVHKVYNKWKLPALPLFIVLPSDLNTWDEANPSTHQFRLYFMCDVRKHAGTPSNLPRHVHLSGHPGYSLKRPREFFQEFGDYVLQLLKMVKHGYLDRVQEIPPLNTFKILWNSDLAILGSHVTTLTIGALVEKAIAYLQERSQPNWILNVELTRDQRAAVQMYLDIEDCDNSQGNLYRLLMHTQHMFWLCSAHTHQYIYREPLERLKEFVCGHGGHVDMQQATLRVELSSPSDADLFITLLKRNNCIFDITIKLCWKTTRPAVEELCLDIAKTNTSVLEIDGITLDTHPQGHCQDKTNFFADQIMADTEIELITLLNYPRSQEQCIFVDSIELHLMAPVVRPAHRWMDLRFDLQKFRQRVTEARTTMDCKEATIQLQLMLRQRGFPDIHSVTIYNRTWDGALNVEEGAFVKFGASFVQCPTVVVSSKSLKRFAHDLHCEEEVQPFYRTIQIKPRPQEINVFTYNMTVLSQTERFTRLWFNSPDSLRLTLLDRLEETRALVTARVTIGSIHDGSTGYGSLRTHTFCDQTSFAHGDNQDIGLNVDLGFEFLQWHQQLSDYAASFLDIAVQHHPLVLTMLTLDITQLTSVGLTSIQKVLCQSQLERLHIVCISVKRDLSRSIISMLGSVQWAVLRSLAFSGENIEKWIRHWPLNIAPRLLSLSIYGTGSALQELSHSSVLFVHRLIVSSQLAELRIENVRWKDVHDWQLIIESMELVFMESLGLCTSSANQLMSIKDAAGLVMWSFGTIMRYEARLVWPSLTPDFPPLSRHDLVHVPAAFALYTPVHVHFVCIPFDLASSELVDQVLASVRWSALESLVLSGDSIDQWIQHLHSIVTNQLLCLTIRGTGPKLQELSRLSTLIIQRLITSSPLVECTIENIQLQNKCDWMLIIENMDFSFLEKFVLCMRTAKQLISNNDAVDFLMSKIHDSQLKEMSASPKLEMFTLDVSPSSQLDLAKVFKALSQYRLENLRVGCHVLDPILSRFLARILDSVQWLTLEGLVFFGDNIDECIQFLHSIEAPQLSRLYIHGTGTKQHTLSNRTVRFLESITSTSPHVRFHFENVILQNSREWHFIIERIDLSSLESFIWSISSFQQNSSDANAVVPKIEDDQLERTGAMPEINSKYTGYRYEGTSTVPGIFNSKIEGGQYEGMCATLDISILDEFPPPQLDLEDLFSTLSRHSLKSLHVVCSPLDPIFSESLTAILDYINWRVLESLTLSGEYIDEWLQVWPSAVSSQLQNLTLHGKEPALQELSQPSVLFIQQLISMSPMEELKFRNVQLQDKRDWMPIVESLDLSKLKTLGLCERSARQFNSSGDAVDLYNSMFKSTIEGAEGPDFREDPDLGNLVMEDTETEEDTEIECSEFEDSDFDGW